MGFNPKQVLQELDDAVLAPKPASAASRGPATAANRPAAPVDVLDDVDDHTDGTLIEEDGDRAFDQHADADTPHEEESARRVRPGPKPTAAGARPTVDLPVSLGRRYKKVWQDGIAKGKKRTYAEILFDAIEEQAPKLAEHWKNAAAEAEGKATSLFPSRNAQPKRRSREEATKRFTLAGLTTADRKVLEKLEDEWGAPSFVELVIVALDLALPQFRNTRD